MHPMTKTTFNRFVGHALCHPVIGRALALASRDTFRFHGSTIHAPHAVVRPSLQASLFWGIYESAEVRFVQRHLGRSLDVIELGASIGAVSCVIRSVLPAARRVVCVEADPVLASLATENLHRNAGSAPFDVVNRAIDYTGAGEGEATFARRDQSTSGALVGLHGGETETFAVRRTTVASLAREYGLREYALVSDIEGAEAGLIASAPESLDGCRQIIIELHDTEWQGHRWRVEDLIQHLVGSRFELIDQHGPVCYFERS